MRSVEKWSYFKNLRPEYREFLRYVWPFFNIMHEMVNQVSSEKVQKEFKIEVTSKLREKAIYAILIWRNQLIFAASANRYNYN